VGVGVGGGGGGWGGVGGGVGFGVGSGVSGAGVGEQVCTSRSSNHCHLPPCQFPVWQCPQYPHALSGGKQEPQPPKHCTCSQPLSQSTADAVATRRATTGGELHLRCESERSQRTNSS
jgi:hypothetical protein